MNVRKSAILLAAVLCCGALVVACSSDDSSSGGDQVSVSDPWTRITTPTATTGAVYMNLESADGDKLMSASVPTDVAAKTEIHETTGGDSMDDESIDGESGSDMDSGATTEGATGEDSAEPSAMMGMQPIDSLDVPAGEEVSLEPGGYHIMMFDLVKPIEGGDTVAVTLTFENAGEIQVEAEAREA